MGGTSTQELGIRRRLSCETGSDWKDAKSLERQRRVHSTQDKEFTEVPLLPSQSERTEAWYRMRSRIRKKNFHTLLARREFFASGALWAKLGPLQVGLTRSDVEVAKKGDFAQPGFESERRE